MKKFYRTRFNNNNEILCKKIISKENIRRIYYSSMVMIFAVFFITLYINFNVQENINKSIFIKIGITEILSVVFFIIISRISIRNKLNKKFKYIIFLFWTILIVFGLLNSIFSTRNFYSVLPYMIVMSVFCFIPFFQKYEILFFSGLQIISLLISLFIKNINSYELVYCLILLAITSISANIRYKNLKLSFKYKSKLNVAIRQSETDKLTTLLNRRGLEREIYEVWNYWSENKTSIAVIMMDIDYFKKYNDNFGHMEGDICIKKVSSQIKSAIRKDTDLAARVGGEEFLICLSNISSKDALAWVKRLKASIEEMEIKQAPSNFLPYITVSCGLVCGIPENNITFEHLYNLADKELYSAKENGRACIYYRGKCFNKKRISDYKNYFYGSNIKYKI